VPAWPAPTTITSNLASRSDEREAIILKSYGRSPLRASVAGHRVVQRTPICIFSGHYRHWSF
jgi:hypothetical protein